MKKNIVKLELENLQLREKVRTLEKMLDKQNSDKFDEVIEPTFSIQIRASAALDENAVKSVLNEACRFMANQLLEMNACIDDTIPKGVGVRIVALDIDKEPVNLETYGTDEVLWQPHYQTEY